jgi:RNA polymerase sigma factor for flagellar operon FliA
VPRSIQKSQKHILSVTEGLTERLDRDPTHEEVADAMGIDVNALLIQQNESQPRQVVSFDEMSDHGNGEENLSLGERLPDPSVAGPDTEVISQEERRRMLRCLAGLSKSQLTVIVLHYLNDISFRDIARTLSVTPSRVSQIHQSGLGRLRVLWSRNPPGGRHG